MFDVLSISMTNVTSLFFKTISCPIISRKVNELKFCNCRNVFIYYHFTKFYYIIRGKFYRLLYNIDKNL